MNDTLIIKWLHRVLEEKTQDIDVLRERISTLNHQIQHFESMHNIHQKVVINDLLEDVKEYDWKTAIKQVKKQ